MKMVILGASRGTGALAAKIALDRGHRVTAFARSPDKLVLDHPNLVRMRGDFHDRASVEKAVTDQDAVLITASATKLSDFRRNPRYFSQGTAFAVDAMKSRGVRRLVILSALGAGDSRRLLPFLLRVLAVDFLLKTAFADHDRQEKLVQASGLDWIIARPPRLTNGPGRGKYVKRTELEPVPMSMSRADVADFMVSAAESDTWVGHAVQLGG